MIDYIYNESRYDGKKIVRFYRHIDNFVFNKQNKHLAQNIDMKPCQFDPHDDIIYNSNITIKNDRLIRICCLNYQLNKPPIDDSVCDNEKLYRYLDQQTRNSSLFTHITIKDLQKQCDTSLRSSHNIMTGRILFELNDKIKLLRTRFDTLPGGYAWTCINYEHVYCIAKLIWFVLPLFVVSRMFYFLFPIISLTKEFDYLVNNNSDDIYNAIDDIVSFQVVLFGCYYCLVVVWIVNFLNVLNFYYWTKLVGIGSTKRDLYERSDVFFKSLFLKKSIEQYNKMIDDIQIQQILCQYLGDDIASIVFEYFLQISISI